MDTYNTIIAFDLPQAEDIVNHCNTFLENAHHIGSSTTEASYHGILSQCEAALDNAQRIVNSATGYLSANKGIIIQLLSHKTDPQLAETTVSQLLHHQNELH